MEEVRREDFRVLFFVVVFLVYAEFRIREGWVVGGVWFIRSLRIEGGRNGILKLRVGGRLSVLT